MDHDKIIEQAWELYRSPAMQQIEDYTKYDALYDTVAKLGLMDTITDKEYDELLDEMQYQ